MSSDGGVLQLVVRTTAEERQQRDDALVQEARRQHQAAWKNTARKSTEPWLRDYDQVRGDLPPGSRILVSKTGCAPPLAPYCRTLNLCVYVDRQYRAEKCQRWPQQLLRQRRVLRRVRPGPRHRPRRGLVRCHPPHHHHRRRGRRLELRMRGGGGAQLTARAEPLRAPRPSPPHPRGVGAPSDGARGRAKKPLAHTFEPTLGPLWPRGVPNFWASVL
jgi:hypothetical protein